MIYGERRGRWMIKGFAKDTLPWPLRNSGLFRHVQVLSELLGSSGSPRHVAPLNNPPPLPRDSNWVGVSTGI